MLTDEDKPRSDRPRPTSRGLPLLAGDYLVALLVILLAALLFSLNFFRPPVSAVKAVLLAEGDPVRVWEAQELLEGGEESFEIKGYHYRIEWKEGRIRFAQADCPDQVCVRSGWLQRRGKLAACLPGGLVLKIVDEGQGLSDDVDVVIR